MTPKQEEVLKQIHELAKEHFDSYIMAIDTEHHTDTDRIFELSWNGGGITSAIGLASRALNRFHHKANIVPLEDE